MSALDATASSASLLAVKLPRTRVTRRWPRMIPLALIVLVAIVGPFLLPYDPERVVGGGSVAPDGEFWFGTDPAGLDVFSRTVAAARTDLLIAALVAVIATAIGMAIGLLLGMNESSRAARGIASRVGARIVDLAEAVPAVVVGLVAVAFYGGSVPTLTIAIALVLSPIQIRLVRTEVLRVRSEAYLDAARMAGMSERELTLRHVLPNSVWAALENSSVIFALAIILTASLGFLGVGLPSPEPEWGSMLSNGASDALVGRWWSALFPAAALALTVAAFATASGAVFRGMRR